VAAHWTLVASFLDPALEAVGVVEVGTVELGYGVARRELSHADDALVLLADGTEELFGEPDARQLVQDST